jgi:hypothetical protein
MQPIKAIVIGLLIITAVINLAILADKSVEQETAQTATTLKTWPLK